MKLNDKQKDYLLNVIFNDNELYKFFETNNKRFIKTMTIELVDSVWKGWKALIVDGLETTRLNFAVYKEFNKIYKLTTH